MKKRRKRYKTMSIEQQIKACENRISYLEHIKRTTHVAESGQVHQKRQESRLSDSNLDKIERDLDDNYQQIALLKIRRMMGF